MFVLSKQKWMVLSWKKLFGASDVAKGKVTQPINHKDRDKARVRLQLLVRAPLHNLLVVLKINVLGLTSKSQFPNNLLPLSPINRELLHRLINAKGRERWVNQQKLLLPLEPILSKL